MADRNGATFLEVGLAFLLGAVFGGVLALLYAPMPGREARQILREKAEEIRDKAELAVEQARVRLRRREAKAEEQPLAAEGAAEVEGV